MISDSDIRKFLDSSNFAQRFSAGDHPTLAAALPEGALEFLIELARALEVRTVFEFGSGLSTAAFLKEGFTVTSLEDSHEWMDQTLGRLPKVDTHTALVRPLRRRMLGLFPVLDWTIDAELARKISEADLILVDSPYYAPFRESTLWSALLNNDHAVIVLDDTRIPTLGKFCDRIAAANPTWLHRRVEVGHGFDLFARLHDANPPVRRHTLVEIMKGWRRFLMAPK